MRFHLPALPGQAPVHENSHCAYTTKVRRWATMMQARGHEVIVYAGEACEAGSEHVVAYLDEPPPPFEPREWIHPNRRVLREIKKRQEPGDWLCLIAGVCQQQLADGLDMPAVEFGIGYGGTFAPYRVFESRAWMHAIYGADGAYARKGPTGVDPSLFDAVIPNYFDVDDFPKGDGEGDYLLYMGRMIWRKGIEIAEAVASETGAELLLAGAPGDYKSKQGTYLGLVGPEMRATLMGSARMLIAPTIYIEPFGGVAVESQLCGTPVLTTDHGAFGETVVQGKTGYRCKTVGEFAWAWERGRSLSREATRRAARRRYSTEVIAEQYERYFQRLGKVIGGAGWKDTERVEPQ